MMTKESPCASCTRVKDPHNCENKNCQVWQRWYIARWEQLRCQLGGAADSTPSKKGQDPCETCLYPKPLCAAICNLKKDWLAARKEGPF